jgi:predicted transcriptional regulator
VRVPEEYHPDFLDRVLVRDVIKNNLVTLRGDDTLENVRAWIASRAPGSTHQGYPVLGSNGFLSGVVTRRDILDPDVPGTTLVRDTIKRHLSVVFDDCTLRQAADHMVNHDIGRLPVISRTDPTKLLGIVTRSDLLAVHRQRIRETSEAKPTVTLGDIRDRWKNRLGGTRAEPEHAHAK